MNFDSWTQFSDENAQRRLVSVAQRIGLHFSVDSQGRFHFCAAETLEKGKSDPSVLALDEEFGPDWIALQEDSDDLQRCVSDLTQRGIKHLVETTSVCRYVIVDKFLCPPEWINDAV
jgi:hypothetical protein